MSPTVASDLSARPPAGRISLWSQPFCRRAHRRALEEAGGGDKYVLLAGEKRVLTFKSGELGETGPRDPSVVQFLMPGTGTPDPKIQVLSAGVYEHDPYNADLTKTLVVEVEVAEDNELGLRDLKLDCGEMQETLDEAVCIIDIDLVEPEDDTKESPIVLVASARLSNAVYHAQTDEEAPGLEIPPNPSGISALTPVVRRVAVVGANNTLVGRGAIDTEIAVIGDNFEDGSRIIVADEGAIVGSSSLISPSELRGRLSIPVEASMKQLECSVMNPGGVPSVETGALSVGIALDCGSTGTPVLNGHRSFTVSDYTSARGYGYAVTTNITARHRATGTALTRDFHEGTLPATFLANIPNGYYYVRLDVGDPEGTSGPFSIKAEGVEVLTSASTGQGEVKTVEFYSSVTDGILHMELLPTQGKNWKLNGIALARVDGTGSATVNPKWVAVGEFAALEFEISAGIYDLGHGGVTVAIPEGWSQPQTSDPLGEGYVSAASTSGGMSPQVLVQGRTIRVTIPTFAAGDAILLTYGDKSAGGPGCKATSAGPFVFDVWTYGCSGVAKRVASRAEVLVAQELVEGNLWPPVEGAPSPGDLAQQPQPFSFRTALPQMPAGSVFRARIRGWHTTDVTTATISALDEHGNVLDVQQLEMTASSSGAWMISEPVILYHGPLDYGTAEFFHKYRLLDGEPTKFKFRVAGTEAVRGAAARFRFSQNAQDFKERDAAHKHEQPAIVDYLSNPKTCAKRSPERCVKHGKPIYILYVNREENKDPRQIESVPVKLTVTYDDNPNHNESLNMNLLELQPNAGMFRAAVTVGDRTATVDGTHEIKVREEDLLKVELQGNQRISSSVMLDTRETGADCGENYGEYNEVSGHQYNNLPLSPQIATAFVSLLEDNAKPGHYQKRFFRHDDNGGNHSHAAWLGSSDGVWAAGLNSKVGADTVDIASLCYHGNAFTLAGDRVGVVFFTRTDKAKPVEDDYKLRTSDMMLGDLDMEYAILFACNLMQASTRQWKNVLNGGAHMILGFKTPYYGHPISSKTFITYCYEKPFDRWPAGAAPMRLAWWHAEFDKRFKNQQALGGKEYKAWPVTVCLEKHQHCVLPSDRNWGWVSGPDFDPDPLKQAADNKVLFYGLEFTPEGAPAFTRTEAKWYDN